MTRTVEQAIELKRLREEINRLLDNQALTSADRLALEQRLEDVETLRARWERLNAAG